MRNSFFMEIIFHEISLDILCSELIYNFLENFKFYSSVHLTFDVLNT